MMSLINLFKKIKVKMLNFLIMQIKYIMIVQMMLVLYEIIIVFYININQHNKICIN